MKMSSAGTPCSSAYSRIAPTSLYSTWPLSPVRRSLSTMPSLYSSIAVSNLFCRKEPGVPSGFIPAPSTIAHSAWLRLLLKFTIESMPLIKTYTSPATTSISSKQASLNNLLINFILNPFVLAVLWLGLLNPAVRLFLLLILMVCQNYKKVHSCYHRKNYGLFI